MNYDDDATKLERYDMRRPSSKYFNDAIEVRVCKTLWGRIQGAIWLLFGLSI